MAVGAIIARIITQYSAKGSKAAQKDINNLTKQFDTFAKKSAKAFGIAAAASAAFAAKIGTDAVRAAMDDQKSQALLASTLRNTVGATDAAIAGTEEYITLLQKQVNVADDELRPALATLARATGDVASAQALLGTALNISAGTGRDLQTVSLALAKASNGNLGALTKLGIQLDAGTIKSKNFDKALVAVNKTFKDQADVRAKTLEFRLIGLQLAYGEILETLGYALLPVIEQFANVIQTKVLPQLEAWINANKDRLAAGLETILTQVPILIENVTDLFGYIQRNLGTIKVLAALLVSTFAATKVYAGVTALTAAIGLLTVAFGAQARAAGAAGIATAFATGGVSALAAASAIAVFAGAAVLAYTNLKKNTDEISNTGDVLRKNEKLWGRTYGRQGAKTAGVVATTVGKIVTNTTKLTAEQKKQLATQEALNKLKAMGVVPTSETDPIQLEAVRLNLLKEQNLAQKRMYDQLLANYEATERTRIAAQRYADILIAISDNKITTFEVEALAAKWGISTAEVLKYVGNVLKVPKINGWDFEGLLAAEGWEAALKALNEYLRLLASMATPQARILNPQKYDVIQKDLTKEFKSMGLSSGEAAGLAGMSARLQAQGDVFMRENPNIDPFTGARKMATGGIVTRATNAIIGEAGPEAVIPLNKMGGMGTTVNITVNGSVTSASDLTEFVRNGILAGQTSGRVITSSVVNL
jgi:hypothetical protein